jgi:hypothetical protein
MTSRRFPTPWQVEQTPGGYKVPDANGQALAYVYARETREQADIAKVLTFDGVRCLRLEDKCRNTELLTYSIEPVAFHILGTSSSIVSKPG